MAGTNTQFKGRGVIQITGHQHGKSWNMDYINHWLRAMTPALKIKWKRLPGLKLQAYIDEIGAHFVAHGLREDDMDPIQAWSVECNCGVRTSFNVWKFNSAKQITMFLMRWSS